ncbi:hypothetical protein HDU97_004262 [Phlyctochytrium planicorne]|nr:hypothetical protein HDU97_004262 [Phlyctochytrium planicorne]
MAFCLQLSRNGTVCRTISTGKRYRRRFAEEQMAVGIGYGVLNDALADGERIAQGSGSISAAAGRAAREIMANVGAMTNESYSRFVEAVKDGKADEAWEAFLEMTSTTTAGSVVLSLPPRSIPPTTESTWRSFLSILNANIRTIPEGEQRVERVLSAIVSSGYQIRESDLHGLLQHRLFVSRSPLDRIWQMVQEHWPQEFGRGMTAMRCAWGFTFRERESYVMMMTSAARRGEWRSVERVYDEMERAGIVLDANLIRIFMELFRRVKFYRAVKDLEMKVRDSGIELDEACVKDLIIAAARALDLDTTVRWLEKLTAMGIEPTLPILNSALACHLACKIAIRDVWKWFRTAGKGKVDLATLTIMVDSYLTTPKDGRGEFVSVIKRIVGTLLNCSEKELEDKVKETRKLWRPVGRNDKWAGIPVGYVFLLFLSVLRDESIKSSKQAYSVLLETAVRLKQPSISFRVLETMKESGVIPDAECFGTVMVDQICRDGDKDVDSQGRNAVERVKEMMKECGVVPNKFYHHKMIKACFEMGRIGMGLQVFRLALTSERDGVDAYTLAYVLSQLQNRKGSGAVRMFLLDIGGEMEEGVWTHPRVVSFWMRYGSEVGNVPWMSGVPNFASGKRAERSVRLLKDLSGVVGVVDPVIASAFVKAGAKEIRDASPPFVRIERYSKTSPPLKIPPKVKKEDQRERTHNQRMTTRRRRRRRKRGKKAMIVRTFKVSHLLRSLDRISSTSNSTRHRISRSPIVLNTALTAAVILRDPPASRTIMKRIPKKTTTNFITHLWSYAASGDSGGAREVFMSLRRLRKGRMRRACEGFLMACIRAGDTEGVRKVLAEMERVGVKVGRRVKALVRARMPFVFKKFFLTEEPAAAAAMMNPVRKTGTVAGSSMIKESEPVLDVP